LAVVSGIGWRILFAALSSVAGTGQGWRVPVSAVASMRIWAKAGSKPAASRWQRKPAGNP